MLERSKNRYGQYFTKGEIAEFMVSLATVDKGAKVLEPSCGEGVFIDKLLQYGYCDLSAYEIDPSLSNVYDFVKYQSYISSPLEDKYSLIIGNPPYIRWKNLEPDLKDELRSSHLWNRYFNSLCDYSFIFILKSIEQLEVGGELIFISTDYWMNNTNSSVLRDYMVRNGSFQSIYHFKETALFDGVSASLVVFKYVKRGRKDMPITLYRYNGERNPSLDSLIGERCFDRVEIDQFRIGERWLLAEDSIQRELEAFENSCLGEESNVLLERDIFRVGEVCDIGNGMVSGLDSAFVIPEIDKLNEFERSLCIDVLKAKNLVPYGCKDISNYLFIQEGTLVEDEFVKNCPNLVEHLKPYVEKLNKRYLYGRDIKYWEFVFPRNYKLFSSLSKRIFVPCKERISNKDYFRFSLVEQTIYPLQDVTAIIPNSLCKESIEYVVAYLNNERVFKWLKYNGIVKGDIVEFSEKPISSIPYRKINWSCEKEIAVHDRITMLVREYLEKGDTGLLEEINGCFNELFI